MIINSKKRIVTYNQFYVLILLFGALFRYLGTSFLGIYDTFGSLVLLFVILMAYFVFIRKFKVDKKIIFLTISYIFICIFTAFKGGGWGSVYYNVMAVCLIILTMNQKFDVKSIEGYKKGLLVFWIYFLLYNTVASGWKVSSGHIGSYNANLIANVSVFMMCSFLTLINKKRELFVLIVSGICVILISKSRTAYFVMVIILFCQIVSGKRKIKPIVLKTIFIMEYIAGVGFPLVYNYIVTSDTYWVKWIRTYSINKFNKNLNTGRETIWGEIFDKMALSLNSMCFGLGSDALSYGSNYHNSYITVLVTAGIIGFVLFFIIVSTLFFQVANQQTILSNRICICYLGLMLVGIAESIVFTGELAILAYVLLGIGLSSNKYI